MNQTSMETQLWVIVSLDQDQIYQTAGVKVVIEGKTQPLLYVLMYNGIYYILLLPPT